MKPLLFHIAVFNCLFILSIYLFITLLIICKFRVSVIVSVRVTLMIRVRVMVMVRVSVGVRVMDSVRLGLG